MVYHGAAHYPNTQCLSGSILKYHLLEWCQIYTECCIDKITNMVLRLHGRKRWVLMMLSQIGIPCGLVYSHHPKTQLTSLYT